MLDLKYVCENLDTVKAALSGRSGTINLDEIAALAGQRKEILREVEKDKAQRNDVTAQIAKLKFEKKNADALILEMKALGDKIKALDERLAGVRPT